VKVIMKELTPNEVSPPTIRFNEDTDTVQQTPDGGETWIDTPQLDPRHGAGFRRPPLTGEDARCDAAAREMAAWKEIYDIFQESVNALQFLAIILNILLILAGGGFGVLLSLILLVFDALVFIGKENMEAAFSEEVWDGVMCIIYNNIGEDGQVSEAELSAIYGEIYDAYPGTVYNTLIEIAHLFGEVLLSNASVERSETGDCSDCPNYWCYTFNFALSDGGWAQDPNQVGGCGTYSAGVGWISTFNVGNNITGVYISVQFASTLITSIESTWSYSSPVTSSRIETAATAGSGVYTTRANVSGTALAASWTGSATVQEIGLSVGNSTDGSGSGSATILTCTVRGEGVNPFGEDNCE